MDNSGKLVERLLSDAERKADAIIADAAAKAEEQIKEAEEFADKTMIRANAEAETAYQSALSRAKVVAELDAKKLILDEKKYLTGECFALAEKKILALPDAEYKKFILALIKKYAENGDVVTLCGRGKKLISADDVSKAAAQAKIKLSIAKTAGKFSGGVVLTNGGVDKNLTLDMQIKELVTELESKVITALGL